MNIMGNCVTASVAALVLVAAASWPVQAETRCTYEAFDQFANKIAARGRAKGSTRWWACFRARRRCERRLRHRINEKKVIGSPRCVRKD